MQVKPLPQVRQRDLAPNQGRELQQEFSNVLLAKVSRPPLLPAGFAPSPAPSPSTAEPGKIHIGTLSQATPTVSELLHQHSEYAGNWWEIVHSGLNKNIDYRHLLPGTEVFLDKNSGALVLVSPGQQAPVPTNDAAAAQGKSSADARIALGTIDGEAPTVSHLLEKNDQTRADTWKILKLPINRDKNFSMVRPGTEIFLDTSTEELIWSSPQETGSQVARQTLSANPTPHTISENPQELDQPISLGKITPATPTVSHLLVDDDRFRDRAWQILFSKENQDKQYSTLRNGTEIFLKPDTGELLWGDAVAAANRQTPIAAAAGRAPAVPELALPYAPPIKAPQDFSSRLASAVKPYYGRPYDEINCYGLVVRGLRRMGIKYLGSGGIRDRLVELATTKGLPPNSFFNGEGLIEATGEKVFSRTFMRVDNAEKEANQLFRDISSKLQKGDILSFSTESSGHTGIISNQGRQWTFINSGDLDNSVTGRDHPAKGVGEENLRAEIKNWLEKAYADRQSLQVTLGRLQEEKLRAAMQPTHRPILSSTL